MILYITGNVGSGKSALAKQIAKRLKFYRFNADSLKPKVYSGVTQLIEKNIPVPESVRANLYKAIEKQLPKIAESHKNIVIDETLHSTKGRKQLLIASKKYFGKCLIVQVKTPKNIVKLRLGKNRVGHMLKNPLGMHNAILKVQRPVSKPDLILLNNNHLNNSLKILIPFIKSNLN